MIRDIVKCKKCKYYIISGCEVLKRSIHVYLPDKTVVSQICSGNQFIPDSSFGCVFGKPKEESDEDHYHSKAPSKNMQKDNTLDKLFHIAKSLCVPQNERGFRNDLSEILTVLITYLMSKEQGK